MSAPRIRAKCGASTEVTDFLASEFGDKIRQFDERYVGACDSIAFACCWVLHGPGMEVRCITHIDRSESRIKGLAAAVRHAENDLSGGCDSIVIWPKDSART